MATNLTKDQWTEILQDIKLTKEIDISIFQGLYSFDGHKAPASQIGLLLGIKGKYTSNPLNSEIGRYGKRIATKYPIIFSVREDGTQRKWDIFFKGWSEPPFFIWQLKHELVEALKETGLTGDELNAEELPIDNAVNFYEGIKRTIVVNAYERNTKAKQICKDYWKPLCFVCGFDFEKFYGHLGKGFIHVHHLTPIHEIGEKYLVNPINDLRPVCPNCHSMLHKEKQTLTIEELKEIIRQPLK